jgi:hypothetical protein
MLITTTPVHILHWGYISCSRIGLSAVKGIDESAHYRPAW